MNIIILIIASDEDTKYIEMQNIWRRYMNNHSNIKSFFIKSTNNIDQNVIIDNSENTMYIKNHETYIPGILQKTISAIEFCIRNFEFDYIYRTNLSSLLDINKLYNFILNTSIKYGGVIGNYNGIKYASGSGFLLSKDTSLYLVENNNLLNYQVIDDISIGELLNKKYNIDYIKRFNIVGLEDNYFLYDNDIFHFRCKFDPHHSITLDIMNKLYKNIYS